MGADWRTRLIAAVIATFCSGMIVVGSLGLAAHYAKQGAMTPSLADNADTPDDHRLAAAKAASARGT